MIQSGWHYIRKYFNPKITIATSYACAINDGAEVIVTGGFGNRNDVLRYSETGFEGYLSFLNEGRQYHACARYADEYGQNVEILVN